MRVVIEAVHEPKARAQRRGEHARAGRGADECEAWQVDLDRSRGWTRIDDDVEAKVLHRRVEVFLDRRVQAVDFINEEHIALLDVCEHACEVAGLFDLRARGGVELGACGFGDEICERGFAEAGWTGK